MYAKGSNFFFLASIFALLLTLPLYAQNEGDHPHSALNNDAQPIALEKFILDGGGGSGGGGGGGGGSNPDCDNESPTTKQGPSGGTGGSVADEPECVIDESEVVDRVEVWYGDRIDGIRFVVTDGIDERNHPILGSTGGSFTGTVDLGNGEVITKVYGRYGSRVDKICFKTNKSATDHCFPSAADNDGEQEYTFSTSADEEIVGVFGREGDEVDAVGVFVREIP